MEEDKDQKKVYSAFISGLPYETKEDDITAFFSSIGNIK